MPWLSSALFFRQRAWRPLQTKNLWRIDGALRNEAKAYGGKYGTAAAKLPHRQTANNGAGDVIVATDSVSYIYEDGRNTCRIVLVNDKELYIAMDADAAAARLGFLSKK